MRALLAKHRLGNKLLVAVAAVTLSCLAAEVAVTWAARHGYLVRVAAHVYEELDEPYFHFDPISGYRISATGFRQARVLPDRTVESVGFTRGNNLGFADAVDFFPSRSRSETRRWAVFGDSFSAGLYLRNNWPNVVEAACGDRIECLNCSIDGGGLANWCSILTRLLKAEEFELDGVLFAVAVDDLTRPFTFFFDDYANGRHSIWGGRSLGLNPATYPTDRWQKGMPRIQVGAAVAARRQMDLIALGVDRFDFVAPRGVYRLDVPPVLWTALAEMFTGDPFRHFMPPPPKPLGVTFDAEQEALMRAIRATCERKRWPCVVVMLPENFLDPADFVAPRHDIAQFADRLGALLIDGRRPFRNCSIAEYREFFLDNDVHWNQKGSNRFADWFGPQLELLTGQQGSESAFRLVASNGTSPGVVTIQPADSDALRVELTGSTPSTPSGVMLRQEDLRFEKDQLLTVQFRLDAERERSITVCLQGDDGAVIGRESTFHATVERKYCQFSVRAPTSAKNGRLCFLLGASDIPVTIADVSLWAQANRSQNLLRSGYSDTPSKTGILGSGPELP